MSYKTPEERAMYAREWRTKHPERAKEIDAKKRAKQPRGAATARMRKWRTANPERAKATAKACWDRYYAANKEAVIARQKEYRLKNIEKYREYNARWHRENRANHPAAVRAMHLKSMYGITLEEYTARLAKQGGRCAICERTPEQEHHGVLHVDHDHNTGKIRGLLCGNHNTALGLAQDDPVTLRALADYVS